MGLEYKQQWYGNLKSSRNRICATWLFYLLVCGAPPHTNPIICGRPLPKNWGAPPTIACGAVPLGHPVRSHQLPLQKIVTMLACKRKTCPNEPSTDGCGRNLNDEYKHIALRLVYIWYVNLLLSDAVTLNMAELGAATVNRILHDKSCSEEEFLKKLLNSRNNEEIVNYLKDSNRPKEDLQVLQKSKNWSQVMR